MHHHRYINNISNAPVPLTLCTRSIHVNGKQHSTTSWKQNKYIEGGQLLDIDIHAQPTWLYIRTATPRSFLFHFFQISKNKNIYENFDCGEIEGTLQITRLGFCITMTLFKYLWGECQWNAQPIQAARLTKTHLLCDDHHTPELFYAGALRLDYFYRTPNYPAAYISGTYGRASQYVHNLRSSGIAFVERRCCPIVNHPHK